MSFDFNNLHFEDAVEGEEKLFHVDDANTAVELLGEYDTCIYTFYGMQTEFRKALVKDEAKLLRYVKEQLEGKNIKGHYVINVLSVTRCPYDRVTTHYNTSGINLQLVLHYQYRLVEKGILHVVKGSVDHIDKIFSYGDDIPVYGEVHTEFSGFLNVKDKRPGSKKLLGLLATEYIKKGLPFPVVLNSFEMHNNAKSYIGVTTPLVPQDPEMFVLVDSPVSEVFSYLNEKVDSIGGIPKELQHLLATFGSVNPADPKVITKGVPFYFDSLGGSFSLIKKETDVDLAMPITFEAFVERVYSCYASLFNLWSYYKNVDYKKDKYLLEFARAKVLE